MSFSDSWCPDGSQDSQPLVGFIGWWEAGLGWGCTTEPGGLSRAFWHRTMCPCHQGKYEFGLKMFPPVVFFVCLCVCTTPLLTAAPFFFCCTGFHHRAALLGGGCGRQNSVGCGCGSTVSEQKGSGHADSRGWLLDHMFEEGQSVPGMCKAGRAAASPPEAPDCGCVLRLWRWDSVFLWCRDSFPHVFFYKFSIHRGHLSVFQPGHNWQWEQQITTCHPRSLRGQGFRWHHNIMGHLVSDFQWELFI